MSSRQKCSPVVAPCGVWGLFPPFSVVFSKTSKPVAQTLQSPVSVSCVVFVLQVPLQLWRRRAEAHAGAQVSQPFSYGAEMLMGLQSPGERQECS